MKIKICGLTQPKETEYLNKYGADLAGFVLFYPKSKRHVSIEQALEIRKKLAPEINTVAVTVSPTLEQTRQICEAGFDYIQIHGSIPDGYFEQENRLPVLKAFNITDMGEYDNLSKNKDIVGFLFDAPKPGSGKTFDWDILTNIERKPDKLFILSGGLNAENVGEAIEKVRPNIVDVSSGVEYTNPDLKGKDPERIRGFINAVRKSAKR